jgi:glycine/D-amino acid oxidase-like deaminating enzyme
MPPPLDLAVIGGGILGLSHAAAGLARGLRVALFERHPAATEASVRNFGLLTSLYDGGGAWGDRALRSRALYRAWHARGGCPLSTPGSLQLAQTPLQWALLQAYAAAAPRLRYPVQLLTPREAAARVPALRAAGGASPLLGALHFPEDSLLEPRAMFSREGGLPAALARSGLRLHWATPIVALRGGGSDEAGAVVELHSAAGEAFHARRVVLCAGADVHSLAPAVFGAEAPKLRLCKLQMMRLQLAGAAAGAGAAPPAQPPPCVVTSGLSLRRYPGPAAVCPGEHAAMMAGEAGSAVAAALGIHIIARPAAVLPRTAFGAVAPLPALGPEGAQGQRQQDLSQEEWVVGDSHEYAAVGGSVGGGGGAAAAPAFDESCSEAVTDEILRVTGTMFQGVDALLEARGSGSGSGSGASPFRARVLQQWSGTYLDHAEGYFSAACIARGAQLERVGEGAAAALRGGTVHIATGIGGKGMTMGPALGEEFVQTFFP